MFVKSLFQSYSSFLGLFSKLTDPLVVALSAYLAFMLRFQSDIDGLPKDYKLLVVFIFFCTIAVFPLFDLYASWRGQSLFKQVKSIFLAWLCVVMIGIVTLFSLKISAGYSRLWLGGWATIGLMSLLFFRISVYGFLQYLRSKGKNLRHVIIVGAGDLGQKVISQANNESWIGYKIIAAFDDSQSVLNKEIEGTKVVDDLDGIASFLSKNKVDEVWLALPLRAETRMKKVLTDLSYYAINVKFIPDIFGFSLMRHSMTEIAGFPAVNLSISPINGNNRWIKEVEDRLFAFAILVLISPLMVLLAISVKLSSPGPILFKQERLSWNGKRFNMLKFRSMPDHDDKSSKWGDAKNKKVTKVGKILRRTSLDELPQFFNVLMGDMSIVGPRPERTEFVEKFKYEIEGYMQKHMVKAGITGWAQINGWRGDTCLKTRIEYDLFYIENWSVWLDLKIIVMTLYKGFVNKNAY